VSFRELQWKRSRRRPPHCRPISQRTDAGIQGGKPARQLAASTSENWIAPRTAERTGLERKRPRRRPLFPCQPTAERRDHETEGRLGSGGGLLPVKDGIASTRADRTGGGEKNLGSADNGKSLPELLTVEAVLAVIRHRERDVFAAFTEPRLGEARSVREE